jgi:hypothetical protein
VAFAQIKLTTALSPYRAFISLDSLAFPATMMHSMTNGMRT